MQSAPPPPPPLHPVELESMQQIVSFSLEIIKIDLFTLEGCFQCFISIAFILS